MLIFIVLIHGQVENYAPRGREVLGPSVIETMQFKSHRVRSTKGGPFCPCKIENDGGKPTQRKAKDQENNKAGERNVVK